MSLRRAFKAFFSNPDWLKKSALGMLGILVPYVGAVVVMGYGVEYMRGVAWRDDDHLPEWRDLERYLKTGFKAFVVSLVYMIPLFVFFGIVSLISVLVMVSMSSPERFFLPLMAFIMLISLPLSLLWSVATQSALMRFAAFDTIREGLRVKEVAASTIANRGSFWGALWRWWLLSLTVSGVLFLGYGVIYGGVIAATLTGSDTAALAAIGSMYCGQFVLMIVAAALGVLVQLIGYHLWGQYLAVAYPAPLYESTRPVDHVAEYGAGYTVLPTAPGQPAPPDPSTPPTQES